MDKLDLLTKKIIKFRNKRDWKQFHNPKDLAISLSLEASEVLEHFQWKNTEEMKVYVKNHKNEIGEEISDVLYWILLMGHDLNIDVFERLNKKMKNNEEKYPVKKAKGVHTKYNKL
ncbi:MAG: nucleotide pyrophosphohydrolase [bacterium]|nr:nucleotide pyrophosphohydrolase [bacterium]